MTRGIFEKNTMDNNSFSIITNVEINFIDTRLFTNKMIVNIEFVGNKNLYLMVLANEDLEKMATF